MDLSIIIVNFNHKKLIQKCLETIAASNPSMTYEIIVVDNGSDYKVKDQIAQFKRTGLPVHLIQNIENKGFGIANNQGVQKANGEYVLFLNTDIEVLDSALDELYAFTKSQKDPVVVGGKLFNTDRSDQPSAGPFYTLWVTFVMLFMFGDRLHMTRYSPNDSREVGWVSGACFMMKRSDFKKLQGFDESIFMYMEEVDLLYRASKMGIKTLFCHTAQFIHIGAATSKSRTKPMLNIFRGLIFFYKTHYPDKTGILRLLLATKAHVSVILGKLTGNTYLVSTYGKALQIVKEQ